VPFDGVGSEMADELVGDGLAEEGWPLVGVVGGEPGGVNLVRDLRERAGGCGWRYNYHMYVYCCKYV